ncbi:MAG: hypothetical protein QME81_14645 [bacterium]|nr:hypothetical protein [bacterium]
MTLGNVVNHGCKHSGIRYQQSGKTREVRPVENITILLVSLPKIR